MLTLEFLTVQALADVQVCPWASPAGKRCSKDAPERHPLAFTTLWHGAMPMCSRFGRCQPGSLRWALPVLVGWGCL